MTLRTTHDDLDKAFKEIEDAPDRTMAIVSSALLETVLEDAIVTRLRPMSNTHRDRLFEGEAGFAGFAAKINLGFSLGLYGPKTKTDLDNIRKIRNQFAHYLGRSFSHPDVAKYCKLISDYSKPLAIDLTLPAIALALLAERELRWRYLHAAIHFISGLFDEMKRSHHPADPISLP